MDAEKELDEVREVAAAHSMTWLLLRCDVLHSCPQSEAPDAGGHFAADGCDTTGGCPAEAGQGAGA